MNNTEEWLPVPGYEGLYEVSDEGRVRSVPRPGTSGGPLAVYVDKYGYPTVQLWARNAGRRWGVHQLVALAFIGPRPEGQEVRHLDANRANPRAANLAYGTHAENGRDMARHGTSARPRLTHCQRRGHPLDEANTYIAPDGGRKCRACRNLASASSRLASKIRLIAVT